MASSTHRESMGEGHYVTIQHCENEGCDKYLGVNYPSDYCEDCWNKLHGLSAKCKRCNRAMKDDGREFCSHICYRKYRSTHPEEF